MRYNKLGDEDELKIRSVSIVLGRHQREDNEKDIEDDEKSDNN